MSISSIRRMRRGRAGGIFMDCFCRMRCCERFIGRMQCGCWRKYNAWDGKTPDANTACGAPRTRRHFLRCCFRPQRPRATEAGRVWATYGKECWLKSQRYVKCKHPILRHPQGAGWKPALPRLANAKWRGRLLHIGAASETALSRLRGRRSWGLEVRCAEEWRKS